MSLPVGFERKEEKIYEEIHIPPSEPAPTEIGRDRVLISSLDEVWTACIHYLSKIFPYTYMYMVTQWTLCWAVAGLFTCPLYLTFLFSADTSLDKPVCMLTQSCSYNVDE